MTEEEEETLGAATVVVVVTANDFQVEQLEGGEEDKQHALTRC